MRWVGNSPAQAQEFQVNLNEAIRTLYEERTQIDRRIAKLERRRTLSSGTPRKRKKMTEAKRLEVSRRMKEYWAARRRQSIEGSAIAAATANGELHP
ncbi:MAG: hypothetical protein ACLQGV_08845 [Bryobacteraceae bacterium]